jgi:hypothetical protein
MMVRKSSKVWPPMGSPVLSGVKLREMKFEDDVELDRIAYELRRSGRALKLAKGARGFWQEMQTHQDIGEFDLPQTYARLGDKEKALQGLERNYEQREPLATLLNVDPAFDSLRSDPRFGDLVRRMGLTANPKSQ